ncbi:4'-phosphopantetheinyl transferase family protein [Silvibacterium sp.]|uniref:4'-phosphopantetheinyl transferase family protein n=1 Tax=Silvibacterium sp. TaxID=1964179 RepID=UPI0039E6A956
MWLSDLDISQDPCGGADLYLNWKEIDMLQARAPRHRHHWVMGRIAAKDAVRHHLTHRGRECPSPSEITITSESGKPPIAALPNGDKIRLSIAHSGHIAVAMSGDTAVGIDAEILREHAPGVEELSLSARERRLLTAAATRYSSQTRDSRCRLFLRFWAAKEAVAKVAGTGLAGRLSDLEIVNEHPDYIGVQHHPTQTHHRVHTFWLTSSTFFPPVNTEYVVAWTRCDR